jgi:hypothetical protein
VMSGLSSKTVGLRGCLTCEHQLIVSSRFS